MAKAPSQGKLRTVIAVVCQHENRRTNGKTKAGAQRYRCKTCGASWTESTEVLGGMRIGMDRAAQIIEMLCEGLSLRSVARLGPYDTHIFKLSTIASIPGDFDGNHVVNAIDLTIW